MRCRARTARAQRVFGQTTTGETGEVGKQPSKRARKRDVQWFRPAEARTLLEACRGLQPRWVAFLMVCFGGGLRWGETTALRRNDIDWARERVHVARTWSDGGGRIEPCKDGEDRWVKLPPATTAPLRAHLEAMDLEGGVREWTLASRQLVFPNTVGRVTRYGAFLGLIWQPLPDRREASVSEAARDAP